MTDRMTIRVPLTDEHARLYRESPVFRQGVDAMLHGVLPMFFDGLAQRAAREDADLRARVAVMAKGGAWPGLEVDGG